MRNIGFLLSLFKQEETNAKAISSKTEKIFPVCGIFNIFAKISTPSLSQRLGPYLLDVFENINIVVSKYVIH